MDLDWTLFGNSLVSWLIALGAGAVTFAALYGLRRFVLAQLRRLGSHTRTNADDIAIEAVAATRNWYLVVVALWVTTLFLAMPPSARSRLRLAIALVTLAQIGIWCVAVVRGYVQRYSERKLADDPASVTTVRALGFLATVVVWVMVGLVALDTLHIEVTAMVAGLGIGGVAVALAVQNILGDLFASLSIVLDKPFVYGDFIVIGDMSGTVEKVGLKTTRVRSLSGEQLVFSNSDLLQSRIRNYKRMFERRVVFTISVVFQTSRTQVAAVPAMLREAVESQDDVRFDRAHFSSIGPSSFDFEVVYYVLASDYGLYMDRQQAINLAILDAFAEAGIDLAYPTQTLVLERPNVPQP